MRLEVMTEALGILLALTQILIMCHLFFQILCRQRLLGTVGIARKLESDEKSELDEDAKTHEDICHFRYPTMF